MNKNQNYLAEGFRNVDGQSDVNKFKTCLAFIQDIPSFKKYKEETDQILKPEQGNAFIDIGCGLGFDIERISRKTSGTVFGLDASYELLSEARHRAQSLSLANVEYILGDAHNMSFEDGRFDGARADRVLQHVEDPGHVIAEMARIVRKGGRIVCAEPDWGSFFVDDDEALCVEAVSRKWTGSFKNPHMGRQLARLMRAAGLTDIKTSGHLLPAHGLEEVNLVFDLEKTCEVLTEETQNADVCTWYKNLALRDSHSPVFAGVTIIIAAGVKE